MKGVVRISLGKRRQKLLFEVIVNLKAQKMRELQE